MKSLLPFALLALLAGVACSSSSPDVGKTCALPHGEECCDGDVLGTFTCDVNGNAACSTGTHLTPADQCTLPLASDAGSDAPACVLPQGMDCCDGDVEGTFTCDADGGVVCSAGTHLTPTNECTLPPALDAGHDANP